MINNVVVASPCARVTVNPNSPMGVATAPKVTFSMFHPFVIASISVSKLRSGDSLYERLSIEISLDKSDAFIISPL